MSFEMVIYDRWGNRVFFSDDISKGWDGRVEGGIETVQTDVYIYHMTIKSQKNKHVYEYRGQLNLVR